MNRRRWLVVSLAALFLGLGLGLAAPFWVRHRLQAAAQARGFELSVASIKLRPTRLWLEDVRAVHQRLTGLNVSLPWIEVRFGITGLREVIVHGGDVQFKGELDALRAEFGRPSEREPEKQDTTRTPSRRVACISPSSWAPSSNCSRGVYGCSARRRRSVWQQT
jgi:hypothetical protein